MLGNDDKRALNYFPIDKKNEKKVSFPGNFFILKIFFSLKWGSVKTISILKKLLFFES